MWWICQESIYLCKRWAHISYKFVSRDTVFSSLAWVMPCYLLPLSGKSSISHSRVIYKEACLSVTRTWLCRWKITKEEIRQWPLCKGCVFSRRALDWNDSDGRQLAGLALCLAWPALVHLSTLIRLEIINRGLQSRAKGHLEFNSVLR